MTVNGWPFRASATDSQRLRHVDGADQHDVTDVPRDHLDAPQNEGAHHDLAQIAVRLYQREQVVAIDLEHLTRLGGADLDEPTASGEDADLAIELPGPVHDDHFFHPGGRDI